MKGKINRDKSQSKLTIRNDIVFKAVFGREDPVCKYILTDLLNSILGLKDSQRIKTIIYKNPFNFQEIPSEKLSVMDIKVETEEGNLIDIEMQVGLDPYFRKRSLYYWALLYGDTIGNAIPYRHLKKCIVINILNFECITESNEYHTEFQVLEKHKHFVLTEDLEMHFIQLPMFDDHKPVEEMTEIEQWVTFIKDSDDKEKIDIIDKVVKRKEVIKMAADVLKKVTDDEIIRERIFSIEKARHDQISKEDNAREEGIEIGKEEGAIQKSRQIALRLIKKGMSTEEVSAISELSTEEIEKLRSN